MVITLEMISRVDCIYKILFDFVSAITTIWYTLGMVIYRCRVPGFPESRFFSLRVRNRGSTRANWVGGEYEGLYALGIMALGQFCGDSLATNENFGMVQNFITVL